ncbi:MAG: hypothetical protein WD342_17535 [Verrucomicrobiales bacterium]
MKPSKEELESEFGELPDVPISSGSTPPDDDPESGVKFDFVGFVIGKYQVFRKTKFGQLVEIYVFLCGLGFPLPTPYDGVTVAYRSLNDFSQIAHQQIEYGFQKPPDRLVINRDSIQSWPPNTDLPLNSGQFPTGTVGSPVSGSLLG